MEHELINKNIKLMFLQILNENMTEKILLSSISKVNIKDLIGEKIIKYADGYDNKYFGCENIETNKMWYAISKNPNITIEFVAKHPKGKWNYCGLLTNPNITKDLLANYAKEIKIWTSQDFSQNNTFIFSELLHRIVERDGCINLLLELVDVYPACNFHAICQNGGLKVICRIDELNWEEISANPKTTMEYVEENMDKNGIGLEYHLIQI